MTTLPPQPEPDQEDEYLAKALDYRTDVDPDALHRLVERAINSPHGFRDPYNVKKQVGLELFHGWSLEDIAAHLPKD